MRVLSKKNLLLLLLVATISACGSPSKDTNNKVNDSVQTKSSGKETSALTGNEESADIGVGVTESEFRAAVAKVDVSRDEFKGNYTVSRILQERKFACLLAGTCPRFAPK